MANRTDANQAAIVAALRGVGAGVVDLSQVGHGIPDLLVARQGETVLMEVKSAKGKLRQAQKEFRQTWPGACFVVRSVDQALAAIGVDVMGTYAVPEEAGN